jgi:hypothetical protein
MTTDQQEINMSDYQAKLAARAAASKALQAANPHLVPVSAKNNALVAASKNVKIELQRAFPKVKFSAKTSRFSMGDSLRVSWIDGPTTEQVKAIADKYSGGSFDGMQDLYTYERGAWTDSFGDSKYVSCDRSYSDEAIESAIRTVKTKYAGNLTDFPDLVISVEQYRKGAYYTIDIMGASSHYWMLGAIIGRTLSTRTWALDQSPKAVEMEEVAA